MVIDYVNSKRLEEFVKANGEDIENFLPQLFLNGIITDLWIRREDGVEVRRGIYAKLPLLENLRKNKYRELDVL